MGNRKPNWMVWANVPTVELLGAIALSLDIDPREVRHSRDGWMAGGGEPFLDEGKEFLDRLEVAKRNLSQSGPLVPTALVRGAPHKCEAPISAFGQWARSIGWELPNEFPTSILATPPIQTVPAQASMRRRATRWRWLSTLATCNRRQRRYGRNSPTCG